MIDDRITPDPVPKYYTTRQVYLQIVPELVFAVTSAQCDFKDFATSGECSQTRNGLFATAANTDQESVAL